MPFFIKRMLINGHNSRVIPQQAAPVNIVTLQNVIITLSVIGQGREAYRAIARDAGTQLT